MRFVASVDPVDNEETKHEKQVAEVHPFSFVQLFCSEFCIANSQLTVSHWPPIVLLRSDTAFFPSANAK